MVMEENYDWLIWSYEHDAWCGPGRCGYTRNVKEAGRYTGKEALRICRQANRYREEIKKTPVRVWLVKKFKNGRWDSE